MQQLVVAGAGMAGLVAAARARQLGAPVQVREKLDRPGGAMRLSSGVVWRHRTLEDFRADCPDGDPALQRLLWERLDDGLAWLEGLGAPVLARTTGNPRTTGMRFDPGGLTAALARAAGEIRCGDPLAALPDGPVVLATGGFAADRRLLAEHVTDQAGALLLRTAPGATGDGLRLGLAAGARPSQGLDEIYGRAMPAPPARVAPRDFVPLAQLYARHAEVIGADGARHRPTTWSEIDVVQWLARRPGARGTFRVPDEALGRRVGERTVREMIAAAEAAGGPVRRAGGHAEVDVVAGVTTTLGGLAVDPAGRAADGVWAAGQDAGGMATGGYASGLAGALVLGLAAAEAAAG